MGNTCIKNLIILLVIFTIFCEDDYQNNGSISFYIEFENKFSSQYEKYNSKKSVFEKMSSNSSIANVKITVADLTPLNVNVTGASASATINDIPVGDQSVKVELQDQDKYTLYQESKNVLIVADQTVEPKFSNFSIANESIAISSPNGGETFEGDQTIIIEWNGSHEGIPVNIDLFQNNNKLMSLKDTYQNSGVFSWKIPTTILSDGDYRIKITSTNDSNVFDESDNDFTINNIALYEDFSNLDDWQNNGWKISNSNNCSDPPCALHYTGFNSRINTMDINVNVADGQTLSFWFYVYSPKGTLELFWDNALVWSQSGYGKGTPSFRISGSGPGNIKFVGSGPDYSSVYIDNLLIE